MSNKQPSNKKEKKLTPKMYFGKEVEEAIVQYNESDNRFFKERLFNNIIYPALNKLTENVIHNRKFYSYGYNDYTSIKHDGVVHLHERLHKYKLEKGSAFSYFNRITINWINATYNDNNANNQEHTGKLEEVDLSRDVVNETYTSDYLSELQDFCQKWSKWGNTHLDYFFFVKDGKIVPFSKRDRQIANAVFDLFEHSHEIDIYNKKALYIMIRERVDVKTQYITDVVNVLKVLCKQMYLEFMTTGTKYWHRFLYYPDNIELEDIYYNDNFKEE